jgi:hypothetical protein
VRLSNGWIVPVCNRGKLLIDYKVDEDTFINHSWWVSSAMMVCIPMVHRPYVSGFLEIGWRISKEPQEWLPVMRGLPWDRLCAQLLTFIDKFSGACNELTPCK